MPSNQPTAPRTLPRALVGFSALSLLFTVLSLARAFGERLRDGKFRQFEALAPPLPGADFFVFMDRMPFVHHAAFFTRPGYPWTYPAPAAPLYALLYTFCRNGQLLWGWSVLFLITLAGCLIGVVRLSRAANTRGAGLFFSLALLTAWPVYISLQRGNIESWLWLILACGLWAFAQGRWRLAAALIGLAGAFKIYPLLCLALFLRDRRWKEIGLGIGVAGIVTVASLWFINPDIGFAFRNVSASVALFTKLYAGGVGSGQAIFDHSAFELLKVTTRIGGTSVQRWLHVYLLVAGAVMLLLFFLRVRNLPVLNQVLFLIAASVFLPPASFDYALQSLYIPWAWLCLLMIRQQPAERPWHYVLMALFAVELAPMTFAHWNGTSVNGLTKGIALLALIVVSVTFPLPWADDRAPLRARAA